MQHTSTPVYRPALPADRAAIVGLLDAEKLPTADLQSSGVLPLIAVSGEHTVGCIGIQPLGDAGIIRSLAVAPAARRAGIGRELVSRAEALAAAAGIRTLYLLTESAKDYWARARYVAVTRSEAPPQVQQGAEFRSLCPDSADCMRRALA